ncbi:hypothetical protein RU97_GL002227 [Enterococcus canis]|uniref:Glycerol uptake operon antiterminator regulatory protein n=1 Tax=Enterococcus canis TaxID=214095 RepID=A0A1L8REJ7_9ENTE|nr:glycerol-3-phosphate responsive antiterminator [Enterococcus canis]OJG18154.1 hypothetical protein RU97_GL002227 [Enterococcus canis]
MSRIKDLIEANPVIPAINRLSQLPEVIEGDSEVVFILTGDIMNLPKIVERLKKAGKTVFVNIDLIDGLSGKKIAIEYIKKVTAADGIITSKAVLVAEAKRAGLMTVHRYFILDSRSLIALKGQYQISKADVVEIMPGLMPSVIKQIAQAGATPVIASGLVCDKEDILAALNSGALGISTTNEACWSI